MESSVNSKAILIQSGEAHKNHIRRNKHGR